MSNIFAFWWQSQQFRTALSQKQYELARQILLKIQRSGARFNLLEQQFYQNLLLQDELNDKKRELATIRQNYTQARQALSAPENGVTVPSIQLQENLDQIAILKPDPTLSKWIYQIFKLEQIDHVLWQCQGIDPAPFQALDQAVFNFLNAKINLNQKAAVKRAYEELKAIGTAKDPDYSLPYIEYAYFLEYFLDNVYASYLAWFFIYDSNCFKPQAKILDVAAGPGTVQFGLSAFLQTLHEQTSKQKLTPLPDFYISYHFQEQQKSLQAAGLEIWQNYTQNNLLAQNTYWRIDTSDLFSYAQKDQSPLPRNFYDFIVISHCFFWDAKARNAAYQVYSRLCHDHLTDNGYALFVIQQYKFFNLCDIRYPNQDDEAQVIQEFCHRLNMKLVWCKALSSTGCRGKSSNFTAIAKTLPSQGKTGKLMKKFTDINYGKTFVLDDYMILLRK